MDNQCEVRVDRSKPLQGGVNLALTDAGRVVQNLALQVGHIDAVEIGQMQLAHSRGGQVQRHRRAQPAKPDDERTAVFERQLALDIDLLQQNLSAVAQQFQIGQHGSRPSVMRSWLPRSLRLATSTKPAPCNRLRTADAWS